MLPGQLLADRNRIAAAHKRILTRKVMAKRIFIGLTDLGRNHV
jgi:hypothetical protein